VGIDTGFFTMDDVRQVMACPSIEAARRRALESVEAYQRLHSARPENLAKVRRVINTSRTVLQLGTALTNMVLAHPSENLKVVR